CTRVLIRDTRFTTALACLVILLVDGSARTSNAQPSSDSPMVRLLKSKRVPEDRQGTIVDLIGRRGTPDDLEYVYQQTLSPDGFPSSVRVKALEALAGAAANRSLRPRRDREKLTSLVRDAAAHPRDAIVKPAIRLAGIWKLEPAADVLASVAHSAAD